MSKAVPYITSETASRDLMKIKFHSDGNWGRARTKKYLQSIHNKCLELCSFPEIGVDCLNTRLDIRTIKVESHFIFYKMHDNKVNIVRILHEKMDFTSGELFSGNIN